MRSFLPFIILGVCVGMYYLYISPLMMEIGQKRDNLAEYQSLLQKAKELKVKRDTQLDAYNHIPTDNIAKLEKIIPQKFDPVLFLNDLNFTLTKRGLTLVDFSTNQFKNTSRDPSQAEGPYYKTITLSIKAVGQYESFVEFLKDLEANLQIMDVTDIVVTGAVSSAEAKSRSNNLEYTVTFNTYALN